MMTGPLSPCSVARGRITSKAMMSRRPSWSLSKVESMKSFSRIASAYPKTGWVTPPDTTIAGGSAASAGVALTINPATAMMAVIHGSRFMAAP